jgi:tetratricopeptide (TPR) repeat protein
MTADITTHDIPTADAAMADASTADIATNGAAALDDVPVSDGVIGDDAVHIVDTDVAHDADDAQGLIDRLDALFEDAVATVDDVTVEEATAMARDDFAAAMRCGEWLGALSRPDAARDMFEHARDLAREQQNLHQVAAATDRIASALWDAGRLHDAETHLRDVVHIADSCGDDDTLMTARWRLGSILASRDDADLADEALELLSRSRAAAQACGNALLAAECDDAAATVLQARNDHPAAIAALHRAVSVMEAADDRATAARLRANLSTSLIATGSAREAEAQLLTARDLARDADAAAVASIIARLAVLWCSLGKADEAIAELDTIEDHMMPTGRGEQARVHLARAQAYNHLGLRAGARDAATAAIDSLRGAVLPVEHAMALEHLGECASIDDATESSNIDPDLVGAHHQGRIHFGEALALYVIAGRDDDARRVAGRLAPTPPQLSDEPSTCDDTPTGLYL